MIDADVSTNPDDYRCAVDLQLRFRDLDAMGHINNAVYFTYFEIGRAAYLGAIDYPDDQVGTIHDRFPFIMAEISCRFLAPATLDDSLTMRLRIDRFGSKSWGFEYLIHHTTTGAPVATGRSAQVFFDYQTARSIPVPDWFIQQVEAFEGRPLR
ncbi:MAG: thioesterase family protein [bacterium]